MKRRLYIKIIVAAAGLILIGLAVALCVSREIGRTDKRRQHAAVEETVQPEKDPGRQAEQAGPSNDDQRDAAAGSDRDSADRQDPYEKLKQRLNKRKGTADYNGYLVTLREDVDRQTIERLDRVGEDAGLTALQYTDRTYRAATTETIRELIDTDDIERIEANYNVKLCDDAGIHSAAEPNDQYYKRGEQYNLQQLNLPAVWSMTVRGQTGLEGQDLDADIDLDHNGVADDDDIIVAVIDTGYKPGHEDMAAERVLPGVSFARDFWDKPVDDPTDTQGHGTFIAGMLTAVKDNQKGIAGICQAVKVLPIRVFVDRECDDSCIVEAVNYAAEQREIYNDPDRTGGTGISVINMSLGSDEPNESIAEACERAKDAGIILISSAGNDGDTRPSYPAQYTIGVGSTGKNGNISTFSQRLSADNGVGYANKVWVTAPGDDIRSIGLTANGYSVKDGTSFSAPEIAALAALCKSIHNDCDQDEFMQLLRESAVPADSTSGKIDGQDIQYGWGKVDFEQTIKEINKDSEADPCDLTFSVRNEAGSVISSLKDETGSVISRFNVAEAVTVTDIAADQPVEGSGGHWTVTPGRKYRYSVTAWGPYEGTTGIFRAGYADRQLTVVLKGGRYAVGIEITDRDGGEIDAATINVKIVSKNGTVYQKEDDGYYYLANGKYRCEIKADDIIDTVWNFTIDDQDPGWQGETVHKHFTVRKDRLTVRIMKQGSEIRETDLFVAKMLNSRTSRTVKATDESGATVTILTASGILMSDVIQQTGGATCVRKIAVEAIDTEGIGDVRRIELSGDSLDRAMIALVEDPEGRTAKMEEGNYMRLIIDGANIADWVYAPYLVTVSSIDSHNWSAWRTTQEATASATGVRTRVCSVCGRKETQSIARKALEQVRGLDTTGKYAKRRFVVSFDACAGATDYQVAWRQVGESWQSKWTGGACRTVVGGMKKGRLYEFKVRAYRGADGEYGAYSASEYRMMSKASATIRSGKNRIKVRWKKASGAGAYQVCYATNKNYSHARIITCGSKRRSCTIRNLKSGKRYYILVRPVKKSGVTYAGVSSGNKRIRVR